MENYELLEDLGLSTNESKVFLALTRYGTMNGYAAAKYAGISRTMVYDVLKRLVAKKCVRVIEAEPTLYSAVEAKEFITSLRSDYLGRFDEAEEMLKSISAKGDNAQYILNIEGFDAILQEAKRLINEAKDEISLSIWSDEAELLKDELNAASGRGVKLYLFSYCKLPFSFGTQYCYGLSDAENLFRVRRLLLIADKKEMLVGENGNHAEKIGILTKNTMLIKLSTDQIILDIFNYFSMKRQGLLAENMTTKAFLTASDRYTEMLGIPEDIPENAGVHEYFKKNGEKDE